MADSFRGHFQIEKYVIGDRPVREMAVRSVIVRAEPGRVRGYAWSGSGAITQVELSADGGATWSAARLEPGAHRYSWTAWDHDWVPAGPGRHSLLSRATDAAGNVQPLTQNRNELGYANNQAVPVPVVIG